MIPLNTKCYVENEGVGLVEAVCNDRPGTGISFSYCVRLRKSPQKLRWFPSFEVDAYDGPDEEEESKSSKGDKRKRNKRKSH